MACINKFPATLYQNQTTLQMYLNSLRPSDAYMRR